MESRSDPAPARPPGQIDPVIVLGSWLTSKLLQRLPPPIHPAHRLVSAIDGVYERWRQRQYLSELPDHLLDDIGVSRADAAKEARKPFWR